MDALHEQHRYRVEEENRALVRHLGRPRRVLDVGCGIGLNGAAAKRKGARVTGIETAPYAVRQARRRLDEVLEIDLAGGGLSALGDRRFDLILLGDVLEHLPDPASLLARLLAWLDDDGRVIASLPNVAAWTNRLHLLRGRWDYTPSGIRDETHLRFFTLETARRLLESAGLEVLHVDHNPMLARAAKPLVMGTLVHAGDGPTALREGLLYKLYQGLLRPLEDRLIRRAPELLAFQHVLVARRPPPRRRLSLTVGMLTKDEAESVGGMIDAITEQAPDAAILCVDSSVDDTPDIARRRGARVLRQMPPRGHGPAMERLMYAAETELLVYLDCDFTYPPDLVGAMRALVEEEGYDVVNGARTRDKPAAMPISHYLANRGFAAIARLLHGVPTVDVHSGMRAYHTSVIRAFDFDGEGDALPIDTLLYPAKHGYRICELGIDYAEREGVSKLRKISGTVWSFIRLARARSVGTPPQRYAIR